MTKEELVKKIFKEYKKSKDIRMEQINDHSLKITIDGYADRAGLVYKIAKIIESEGFIANILSDFDTWNQKRNYFIEVKEKHKYEY